jgi:outer membrane protein assembly factor BamB
MPSITRRRLLGGAAAGAAGAYGAARLHRGSAAATFDSWSPTPDTWPLRRYDPEGTAHNPNATPPRESPEAREVATVPESGRRPRLRPVVGADHVVVSGTGAGAFPRDGDGGGVPVGPAALAGFGPDGRLHAVRPAPEPTVVGFDDGLRERSSVPLGVEGGGSDPTGLVVGTDGAYVGVANGTLHAVGGGRDWRVDGSLPALADGRLYAADAPLDGTVAYAERRGLDRRLEPGPARRWSAGPVDGFPHHPAVADGRLVVGTYANDGGTVVAFDADTGDALWEPRRLGVDVSTPAVVGDRGYAAVDRGDGSGAVVAIDLATGETRWRDEVGFAAFGPVVGDDTLVVAGDRDDGRAGVVRAYDAETGETLWTRGTEHRPGGVALVGGRVVVTVGASVSVLA